MNTVERAPYSVLNEKDGASRMIHYVDELDESRAFCGYKYKGDEEFSYQMDSDCVVCSELNRLWTFRNSE